MIKSVWKCINNIAISPKRGMEQAEIIDTFWTYQFPLGVTTYYLAKAINSNGEHARITYEHKYKRGKSNILLKHNLNIISQSIGSQQTQHSNSIRITYVPRSCRAAHKV